MAGHGSGARVAAANRALNRQRRDGLARRLGVLGALTTREAALVLGVAASTVRRVRAEYGLPAPARDAEMRRVGEVNRRRAQLRHSLLAWELERLGALTAAEAALLLGVSAHTVKRVRVEHGLPSPRRPDRAGRGTRDRGSR